MCCVSLLLVFLLLDYCCSEDNVLPRTSRISEKKTTNCVPSPVDYVYSVQAARGCHTGEFVVVCQTEIRECK